MLRFYNTRTKAIDEFIPLRDKQVGLYTCGPTVYSTAHIGNLRTYIFEDVLRRTLEFNGYTVKHVMNVTDVGHLTGDGDMGEDKIEKTARETKRDAHALAREYERGFFDDLKKLNILPPDITLRATETIGLQIDLIKKLEKKGVTYKTSDGVYFDTTEFKNYGQLSGQKTADKKAGARVEVNEKKRQPTDFALWKFSKPEDKRQMEWGSPWGVGFPGWHIECSAMSMHELGEQFDIHTGGIDHIPVHHENEIAQSEAATGKHPFVNFWLHGEFIVLPEKRMGKSEGNTITLQNVVEHGIPPLAFRYLVLQTHYRSKLTFSWQALEAAAQGLNRVWGMVDNAESDALKHRGVGCAEFEERFRDAINDDLNTPQALAIMHEMIGSDYPWHAKRQSLSVFDRVLGLDLLEKPRRPQLAALDPAVQKKIDLLIDQREAARKTQDWQRADELRKQINEVLAPLRRSLEDTPNGPEISPR